MQKRIPHLAKDDLQNNDIVLYFFKIEKIINLVFDAAFYEYENI